MMEKEPPMPEIIKSEVERMERLGIAKEVISRHIDALIRAQNLVTHLGK